MKKYYLHDGAAQAGPFDIEELRQKGITRTTAVWCEGIPAWTAAQNINELQVLFQVAAPPPFPPASSPPQQHSAPPPQQNFHAPAQPKKRGPIGWVITLVVLALILGVGAIVVINNPNAIPGIEVDINTPKPRVVTSRADGRQSGLLNARTTVYATVINQGGDGNVLVTFYVFQGNNTYDRTESIYMYSGSSQDLEVTFEEVDYVSGEITYDVTAQAQ